jgi:hypothetical protein
LPGRDTLQALKLGDNALSEGVKVTIHVQILQSLEVAKY